MAIEFKVRESYKLAGHFIKLKSGEKITGIFRGDPYDFKQHWVGGRSYTCLESTACPYCEKGDRAKFRFRINFVVKGTDGQFTAKIFEQGSKMYEHLRALNGGDVPLDEMVVQIMRTGEGTGTTYTLLPVANGILSGQRLEEVEKVPLFELSGGSEDLSEDKGEFAAPDRKTVEESLDFKDVPF